MFEFIIKGQSSTIEAYKNINLAQSPDEYPKILILWACKNSLKLETKPVNLEIF